MAKLSNPGDGRAKPSTIAVSLPEWALTTAGIATDLNLRSKVVTEALLAFFAQPASSEGDYRPDQSIYRRIVEVDLPDSLIAALDGEIAATGWRPRAHAIEEALVAYLDPSQSRF